MIDFFFFVKTFILTAVVVLLLQIEVGQNHKTIEGHVHDFVEGSLAVGFLGHAAHGGAHMVKDSAESLSQKIKARMSSKRHGEAAPEQKASRFHWGWDSKPKKAEGSETDPATD